MYNTNYCCEECTATLGSKVYLCQTIKNGEVESCHVAHHKRNHNKVFLLDKGVGGQ
jgi:hypothetical protein